MDSSGRPTRYKLHMWPDQGWLCVTYTPPDPARQTEVRFIKEGIHSFDPSPSATEKLIAYMDGKQ